MMFYKKDRNISKFIKSKILMIKDMIVQELLEDKTLLITQIYFKLQKYYEKKYGKNIIIMIEIGTFFEIYEINNKKEQIGKAKEVAEILNIQLTRKNKSIIENSQSNPLMAGVPSVSLEKHINKLIQMQKYTIVLVKQVGNPPNIKRVIDSILSPGTNFDYSLNQNENNITSIVVDIIKNNYLIGYSCIDVTTGKSFFNEIFGTSEDSSYALDEVYSHMIAHKTSEIIITFLDKNINQQNVLDYLELSYKTFHINRQRAKINYQNELFKNIFEIKSLLSPIEYLDMERFSLASESLAILIDFIIEHNNTIVQKLNIPIKLNISQYMYLGNNALEQLNILETSNNPNLFILMNNSSTAMGKRLLKERLSHPIKDEQEILKRYKLSNDLYDYYNLIENYMTNIYDIERLNRRIKLNKLHPFELSYLYNSLLSIKEIIAFMETHNFIKPPCSSYNINIFLELINKTFVLNNASKFMFKDINENIIKNNVNSEIDELLNTNEKLKDKIYIFKKHILKLLKTEDKNYVTINRLPKEGFYIQLTKHRYTTIKDKLLSLNIKIDGESYLFSDFNITIKTTNVKLTNKLTSNISDIYINNLSKIIELNKHVFRDQIEYYDSKFSDILNGIVSFIAKIDVAISNIKTSKKLNYVCPTIIETNKEDNFIELIQSRHPIIEKSEDKGLFIPNDIILGNLNKADNKYKNNVIIKESKPLNIEDNHIIGILLYGINSSGKSSLMKTIGICIILAQSGFFVPAKSMRFSLFDSVFTRISGADNIARGLSSFAVEMLELKNIFNRATNKSVILGDEISHSTETMSGLSIVASAILKLSKLKSIFIFATHLHQLPKIKEIENLRNIMCLHLSVLFDEVQDKLIFNRKLNFGSGSSMYGLEFAKSLHMDKEFLNIANKIRKDLTDDYNIVERLSHKKTSRYNKKLYITSCAICREKVDDIHHIKEQKNRDEKGFIGHINANHKYNLIPLCKKHHKEVHNGNIKINGFMTTSKGLELHYTTDILIE